MEDRQREGRKVIIENHIKELMNIFDTVHIHCTKFEKDNDSQTSYYSSGDGNIFARYGQISLWVKRQEEIEMEDVRRDTV